MSPVYRTQETIPAPTLAKNRQRAPQAYHPDVDFRLNLLEPRRLFSLLAPTGEPLPTTPVQEFVIDDWDNDVIQDHFGTNYFAGQNGSLLNTALTLSAESNSPVGESLRLTDGPGTFGGYFTFFGPNTVNTTVHPQVPPDIGARAGAVSRHAWMSIAASAAWRTDRSSNSGST